MFFAQADTVATDRRGQRVGRNKIGGAVQSGEGDAQPEVDADRIHAQRYFEESMEATVLKKNYNRGKH